MSEYFLSIAEKINLSDYSTIYDYMGVVDEGDKFTIKFNGDNDTNSGIIYSMLKDNKFNIMYQNKQKDGKVCITAVKNNEGYK